jgi:aldose 1-epimerase
MGAQVRLAARAVGDKSFEVVTLTAGPAVAEVWPGLGGNCVRWAIDGLGELLDAPAEAELIARPTRGGIPVLFPFPNRIRAGRFRWDGRDYQLPLNDSPGVNAIHGFVTRRALRVTGQRADTAAAAVTLSFRLSLDAPECVALWPADAELTLTWELTAEALTAQVAVTNPGAAPLPFGFGLHPYFRLVGGANAIAVPVRSRWVLDAGLPTGAVEPAAGAFALTPPRPVAGLTLDDVFTDVATSVGADGLREVGRLERGDGVRVAIASGVDIGHVVVFTPPHRRSVCLEPYTCVTDAMNLRSPARDSGWRVVGGGEIWRGRVRCRAGRG